MSTRIHFASLILLLTIFLLAACVQPPASTPMHETSPVGPTIPPEPAVDEALRADAAEYARQYGLSLDEAVQRLSLQNEIGALGATLQSEQTETFAGLWIQHEPVFRVMVAFTQEGEQTIHPYLEGKSYADLVEVKMFPHSLQKLESTQRQMII